MNELKNYSMRDNLPESLRRENMLEIAELCDELLQDFNTKISRILIYPAIDNLPSNLIDALAIQFHVDFYDKNLSLEARRTLVKTGIAWHKIKGTPAAVEMVLRSVFNSAEVSEWFDYGGEPYFFRILARGMKDEKAAEVWLKLVFASKNVRSWLEKLILDITPEVDDTRVFLGLFPVQTGASTNLPAVITPKNQTETLFVGGITAEGGAIKLFPAAVTPKEPVAQIKTAGLMVKEGVIRQLPGVLPPKKTKQKSFLANAILLSGIISIPTAVVVNLPRPTSIAGRFFADRSFASEDEAFQDLGDFEEGNWLRLYFKFPTTRRTRFITLGNPKEDLQGLQVREVGDYAAKEKVVTNAAGDISTGLKKALLIYQTKRIIL